MNARSLVILWGTAVASYLACSCALADPLPLENFLEFGQYPLNNGFTPEYPTPQSDGAPYYGHSELSTASRINPAAPWQGGYRADDFADGYGSPVVHIRWWGTYQGNYLGNPTNSGVKQFLISFESDVPTGPDNPLGYSHPGTPLSSQIVRLGPLAPGSGTFTEKLVPTPEMPGMPVPATLYEYNAELNMDEVFPHQIDTVYWLKIVALVDDLTDGPIRWGWHTRDWSTVVVSSTSVSPGLRAVGTVNDPTKNFNSLVWHFQDDAVSGNITVIPSADPVRPSMEQTGWTPQRYTSPLDGPASITQFSKDLAFELYTIPEPVTLALAIVGLVGSGLALSRRRL